ncbi:MAG: HEAT repeat domain-containing protein, partial [Candidatus Nitrosopelagicus sp.]|nr:HEAT repeat domain-containing protein [Candidatus Nitrosopelagicus sp.]
MDREEILELFKNEDSKQNVLTTLTQTDDPKIIQEIIKLFDDERIEIRGEVFSTLFLNKNNILEQLIYGLKNESKNVRAYVTLVLANRNEKESIQEIIKLTKDSSGLVRTC